MLTHHFIHQAYDIDALLQDTNKLSTFCSKLRTQSTLHPDRIEPETYRGNGLELFTELLLTMFSLDARFGISNYTIVQIDDVGVDGYGIGTNGKPATVQVKFRPSNYALSANIDHLSNFTSSSMIHYDVDPKDSHNMLIITTAKGLHPHTDTEMFANKVRCIGYKQLQQIVDNNIPFWDAFRKEVNS